MKRIMHGSILLPVMFLLIAYTYESPVVMQFDAYVKRQVDVLNSPWATNGFTFFTYLGSKHAIFPTYFGLLLASMIQKRWDYVTIYTFNTFGVRYVNMNLKVLFARERPLWEHLVTVNDYSFPSGHAMNSAAFYGYIVLLLSFSRFRYRKLLSVILICIIFLIGLSRIYLGVHYPTDVVAGWIAGSIWALISYQLLHVIRTKRL